MRDLVFHCADQHHTTNTEYVELRTMKNGNARILKHAENLFHDRGPVVVSEGSAAPKQPETSMTAENLDEDTTKLEMQPTNTTIFSDIFRHFFDDHSMTLRRYNEKLKSFNCQK